ncbi:CAP domain-containing protein [Mycobacterium sp. 94-17]|uniref:CAP domain-containing protein n=1 Tax=Mycobacterium sp. 94-17 TaxID=2986147 RepID=UPI002D1F23AE|nr:CAP domain-containing protein [Mycobacterium sp. 94-17]MEB4209691.1 CAP domain-containing protein [Mycobacterium sp. 94-17]
MAKKVEIIAVFAICTAFITTAPGAVSGFIARADDSGVALYNGINQLRPGCGPISDDPRLTEAAQRHADDMLRSGISGHVGSDGSSPQARITAAGYRSRYSGEIVFWGTGSAATAKEALDMWMQSPPHRDIILNCAYNAGGFATAWDGTKMTAVGDFAAS